MLCRDDKSSFRRNRFTNQFIQNKSFDYTACTENPPTSMSVLFFSSFFMELDELLFLDPPKNRYVSK